MGKKNVASVSMETLFTRLESAIKEENYQLVHSLSAQLIQRQRESLDVDTLGEIDKTHGTSSRWKTDVTERMSGLEQLHWLAGIQLGRVLPLVREAWTNEPSFQAYLSKGPALSQNLGFERAYAAYRLLDLDKCGRLLAALQPVTSPEYQWKLDLLSAQTMYKTESFEKAAQAFKGLLDDPAVSHISAELACNVMASRVGTVITSGTAQVETEASPEKTPDLLYNVALLHAVSGQHAEALRTLEAASTQSTDTDLSVDITALEFYVGILSGKLSSEERINAIAFFEHQLELKETSLANIILFANYLIQLYGEDSKPDSLALQMLKRAWPSLCAPSPSTPLPAYQRLALLLSIIHLSLTNSSQKIGRVDKMIEAAENLLREQKDRAYYGDFRAKLTALQWIYDLRVGKPLRASTSDATHGSVNALRRQYAETRRQLDSTASLSPETRFEMLKGPLDAIIGACHGLVTKAGSSGLDEADLLSLLDAVFGLALSLKCPISVSFVLEQATDLLSLFNSSSSLKGQWLVRIAELAYKKGQYEHALSLFKEAHTCLPPTDTIELRLIITGKIFELSSFLGVPVDAQYSAAAVPADSAASMEVDAKQSTDKAATGDGKIKAARQRQAKRIKRVSARHGLALVVDDRAPEPGPTPTTSLHLATLLQSSPSGKVHLAGLPTPDPERWLPKHARKSTLAAAVSKQHRRRLQKQREEHAAGASQGAPTPA